MSKFSFTSDYETTKTASILFRVPKGPRQVANNIGFFANDESCQSHPCNYSFNSVFTLPVVTPIKGLREQMPFERVPLEQKSQSCGLQLQKKAKN